MIKRLLWNDMKHNKLLSAATVFFMATSAMLLALTMLLFSVLLGAIDGLMEKAAVPDYMQMHAGTLEPSEISRFAESHRAIKEWQISRFLNLDNGRITLNGQSLADSTQDNGLCVQGERFDYLLDLENQRAQALPGEVIVPVCYRDKYNMKIGDTMKIGNYSLVIAGFLRDAQMSSMMASSKRFLVNEADYDMVKAGGNVQEEYLIEFLLHDDTDTNVLGAAYAAEGLPANGPAITRPLIRMMNALSDGTMICVFLLLSIVILLISILCIRFMVSLQMERDRKEVGMLKAVGVGKAEIRRIYFAKYILFSGSGGLLGLLTASFLKEPLTRQLQELYGVADNGMQSAVAAFFAVLFVEGVILLSVRRLLKKTEKLSALEAMYSGQESKTGREQFFLIGLVSAACTLLMLVPQNLRSTMSDPEFVTYMGIGNGEIRMDVRQTENIDLITRRIALELEQDIQVEKYAVLRTKSCTAVLPDGKSVNLTVETGNHAIFPVSFRKGSLPEKPAEIALSAMNAEELGLTVGDTLRLSWGGKETDFTVCGIYSDITNGGKTAKAFDAAEDVPVVWSVLYVSLKESGFKAEWMERYRQMGIEVTDIGDYVEDTYGQTLGRIGLSAKAAVILAALVIFVVTMLFMRLIVEKNRSIISLYKALGFTNTDLKKSYFVKGILPVAAGLSAGLLAGNLFGESLCGIILKSLGADDFRFVISWGHILALLSGFLLGPAVLAVMSGIMEINKIRACECCRGRE